MRLSFLVLLTLPSGTCPQVMRNFIPPFPEFPSNYFQKNNRDFTQVYLSIPKETILGGLESTGLLMIAKLAPFLSLDGKKAGKHTIHRVK